MGYLDSADTIITLDGRKIGTFTPPASKAIVQEDGEFKFIFLSPGLGNVHKANECILDSNGILIRTMTELIFIEKPYAYIRNKPNDPLNKMRDMGLREFFDVPISEIIGYVPSKLSKGIILYIRSQTTSELGRPGKQFYQLSVKPPYDILDHGEILKKGLTRKELKALKREEKAARA